MPDGTITFSTALDNALLEKELERLKNRVFKLENEIDEKMFKKDAAEKRLKVLQEEYRKFAEERAKLEDGKYVFSSREDGETAKKMYQEIQKTADKAEKLKNDIADANDTLEYTKKRYGEIIQKVEGLRAVEEARKETEAAEKRMEQAAAEAEAARAAREAEQRLIDIKESAIVADQKIVDLQEELARIAERRKELESAGVGVGYEEYDNILKRTREINGELRDYQDSLIKIEGETENVSHATGNISDRIDKLTDRIKNLASRVFVFTLITTALRSMRTWMGKAIKTNGEARQSIAQLKGALLALAQPLVEVVIPAFVTLVNVLTRIITAAAQLVSLLFGKTLKQSKDGAKALYEEANAIDAVGAAAKEAVGSLAGFDEINTITTDNAKESGGGGISGDAIKPDFEGLVFGELDKITALVSGASLALGAILAFSGANIPIGLALMAAGAAGLAKAIYENWAAISEKLQGSLGLVTALVGGALLALGAMLLFSGVNIPLGLALIAAGSLGLAAVVAANWDTLSNILDGPIGAVTAAISSALLALGALLAFSGVNLPLGLALMAAGAVGLVASIVANWDTVQQMLEGPVGTITALVSSALLALGAILVFSGAAMPLGLGLLVAGAIGLATSIAANWDTVQQALEGPVGIITALVSSALLALGAILVFSGAAMPLGIGLMAVGAAGLATSIAANWNTVQNALGGPIKAVTAIASSALLVLGIILLFTGAAVPLGLGLMALGAVGLAATVAPNWNFVLDAIKKAWANVKTWWSANAKKVFTLDYWKDLGKNMIDGLLAGLKGIFSGLKSWAANVWSTITGAFSDKNAKASISNSATAVSATSVSAAVGQSNVRMAAVPQISEARIPHLARGAVIPPNREFMAVLGDQKSGNNLEMPEGLLRQVFREEFGNSSAELVQLLRAVLAEVKEGHVIMVDGQTFGRTVIKTANSVNMAAGKNMFWF